MPSRREILIGTPSMLITDHYHYFENSGENYHVDIAVYDFIRGHENDSWVTTQFEQEPIHPLMHTSPNQERSRQRLD